MAPASSPSDAAVSDTVKPDYPNRIREVRRARGMSQQMLAGLVNVTQPSIDRLEKGGRKLSTVMLEQLATALEVSPADLLPVKDDAGAAPGPLASAAQGAAARALLPGVGAARDLPILGYVKAGTEGFFIVNGEVQGLAARPDLLQGVRDAYAVYVHDQSMFPAFEPGHLAWVDPLRPVKIGDAIVVQLNDGQAFIKRLKRRTEKFIICEQWNPATEIKYDAKKVRSIHLVVGSVRIVG
jgi:phage repressor protein C with HTH and peptisase S24 domain